MAGNRYIMKLRCPVRGCQDHGNFRAPMGKTLGYVKTDGTVELRCTSCKSIIGRLESNGRPYVLKALPIEGPVGEGPCREQQKT